jgi:purine-cytosine permease-like protein
MVLWIAPWCGIYLADMALRRSRYDVAALFARSGPYWFRRGFNLVGLGWFVAGIAVAALFANSAVYVGPLVGWVGGGDISIFVGIAVSFTGYLVTMRGRAVPAPDSAAVLPAGQDAGAVPAPRVPVAEGEGVPA